MEAGYRSTRKTGTARLHRSPKTSHRCSPKPATLPIPIANQIAGSPTAGPRGDHRHD
jgi:hypothetical protein